MTESKNNPIPPGGKLLDKVEVNPHGVISKMDLLMYISSPTERRFIDEATETFAKRSGVVYQRRTGGINILD